MSKPYYSETQLKEMTFDQIASCSHHSHRGCWECREELTQRIEKALRSRPAFPDDDDRSIMRGERGFLIQTTCGYFLMGSGDWSENKDMAYFCNMELAKALLRGAITGGIRYNKELAKVYPTLRYTDQPRVVGRPINISSLFNA